MILEAYQDRAKRDARARELKAKGYTVKRYSTRGAQMHPEYVNDYMGPVQSGAGNTQYKMLWGALYHLDARPACSLTGNDEPCSPDCTMFEKEAR